MSELANTTAEQAVLGACLLDSGPIRAQILAEVRPADMWRGSHATCLAAIADLHTAGQTVDPVTVDEELRRRGVDAPTLTSDAAACVPSAVTGIAAARQVADLARRRRVVESVRKAAEGAADLTRQTDAVVAEATDALTTAAAGRSGALDAETLVEAALEALDEGDGPVGWAPPWRSMQRIWRIVPGWLHIVTGWRSSGKSAVTDALIAGLAESDDVRSLVWSPEGAPCERHLLRMARIRAGALSTWRPGDAVADVSWMAERVAWLDHTEHTTLPAILAAADAHRAKHRLDLLLIDPFTSVDKFDSSAEEGWDRALNRHLARAQAWARSRNVALVMVAHPKQRERTRNGTRPVATDADIHGGIMWGNLSDSLVSVWRDESGHSRPAELVDIHVQKIRDDGRGGVMGRMATLRRDPSGRYRPIIAEAV